MNRIKSYSEFWPFYLSQHSNPANRWFHFIGTTLGLFILIFSAAVGKFFLMPLALVVGYGFAWVGHFGIEGNRPATFIYPFWSFISDWRMWFLMLIRKPLN